MDKPWFKFTSANWLSGSVQLLSDAEKGTYIDLLAMIWKEDGSLKLDKILSRKLRLDHATVCDRIDSYCELEIMVCDGNVLNVKFLSDQLSAFDDVSKKNSENAKKRWAKKDGSKRPNANKKREEEKREDNKESKTKAKTFTPPQLHEVSQYCIERKNGIDAQKFIDHYSANGWMRGKNKIKDWKACVRTWEGNQQNQQQQQNNISDCFGA